MISPSLVTELITGFGAAASASKPIDPMILVATLAGLGATFGFLLAFADKKIAVKLNPLIHEVEEVLPKGQCGACGYPGCAKYAEAVVEEGDVACNLCIPGGSAVAEEVARLTGKAAAAVQPRIAVIKCVGDKNLTTLKYRYDGIPDCRAASLIFSGSKACDYGCLGYGNCLKACLFDALSMGANDIPVVDLAKCIGCGACVEACPRLVIELVDTDVPVIVPCQSHDKAGAVKKQCQVGCIGCGLCKKACDKDAIEMNEFLPNFDLEICKSCDNHICLTAKCKTKIIRRFEN